MATTPTPQPTSPKLSVDDFAQRIKAKYPEYGSLDNADLAQKVVAKYPEYADKVEFKAKGGPTPTAPVNSTMTGIENSLANSTISPPESGFGPAINRLKGRIKSLFGLDAKPAGELVGGPLIGPLTMTHAASELMTPPNPDASVGHNLLRPVKAVNEGVKGLGQTLGLPLAVANPATLAVATPAVVAQTLAQKGLEKAGINPDVAELGGNVVGLLGGAKLAKSAGIGMSEPSTTSASVPSPAPLAREAGIFNLRRAVNPNATDAPGFMKELGSQYDTIARIAQRTGVKPSPYGPANTLADIVSEAAKADQYRKTFIDPYTNEPVSTGHIPGHEPMETIGSLDSRLHEINSTLTPKYTRGPAGSPQQIAAVDAEQSASLQREGAAIRQTIANEVSKRTGVPADQIAAARKNYGELSNLADTIRYYGNEAFAKGQGGPLKVGDIVPSLENPTGALSKVPVNPKNWFSSPEGRLIKSALLKYQPGPEETFTPTVPTSPNRPLPPWAGQGKANTVGPDVPQIVARATTPPSAPAIPADVPGLLRPGNGTAPSSSPLPFGPMAANAPVGEVVGRMMTVGQELPRMPGGVLDSLPPEIQDAILGRTAKSLPPATSTQLGPSGSSGPVSNEPSPYSITPEPNTPLNFQRNGAPGGFNTIDLNLNGQKVGYASVGGNPYAKEGALEVKNIKLNPETQGQGHGTQFYKQLAQYAQGEGATSLMSDVLRKPGAEGVWNRLARELPDQVSFYDNRWHWDFGGKPGPALEPRITGTRQGTRVSVPRSQLSEAVKDGFTPDQGQ